MKGRFKGHPTFFSLTDQHWRDWLFERASIRRQSWLGLSGTAYTLRLRPCNTLLGRTACALTCLSSCFCSLQCAYVVIISLFSMEIKLSVAITPNVIQDKSLFALLERREPCSISLSYYTSKSHIAQPRHMIEYRLSVMVVSSAGNLMMRFKVVSLVQPHCKGLLRDGSR